MRLATRCIIMHLNGFIKTNIITSLIKNEEYFEFISMSSFTMAS